MLPRRLVYLIQVALAVVQHNKYDVSAFSFPGVTSTSRVKIRRHARTSMKLRLGLSGGFNDELFPSDNDHDNHKYKSSHIVSIKSSNIAGMVNDGDGTGIQVDFGNEPCLVAVTGESGSGKSLLVSKAIDLVTGGKAVSSLIPPSSGESEQDSISSVELSEYIV